MAIFDCYKHTSYILTYKYITHFLNVFRKFFYEFLNSENHVKTRWQRKKEKLSFRRSKMSLRHIFQICYFAFLVKNKIIQVCFIFISVSFFFPPSYPNFWITIMKTVNGLDVHKSMIMMCILKENESIIREFFYFNSFYRIYALHYPNDCMIADILQKCCKSTIGLCYQL